jgi:iron complex outermembrane recepter protein
MRSDQSSKHNIDKGAANKGAARGMTARGASVLISAAILLPAASLTTGAAYAQSSTSTPLPAIPVETKKPKPKHKVKPPVEKVRPGTDIETTDDQGPAADDARPQERGLAAPSSGGSVSGEAIASKTTATSDTASLLRDVPGVSMYGAGGVSSLPVIHGMEDDRVKTQVNGMTISSACANHMNPVLSYVDPTAVKNVEVIAGVTPVSAGGDSIGGTIVLDTLPAEFAGPGEGVVLHGGVSSFVRSNGMGVGGSAMASAATRNFSIMYNGAYSRANDYERGGDGKTILSTDYEAQNHMLTLAARGSSDLLVVNAGVQHIPYQGFVNQRMDMTGNDAWFANVKYETKTNWGKLDARAFYQNTSHAMNFLADKGGTAAGGMPMYTDGTNFGYSVKAEIPVSAHNLIRIGNELHGYQLDDWWPPIDAKYGKPGMAGPNAFQNINGGERYRLGTFAEWETKWNREWSTLLGVRNDIVWMDTGDVVGYNSDQTHMMPRNYWQDMATFNALDHARTDVNFDLTALARYEPDSHSVYEAGYARKTRSPNLYERYAWSTSMMGTTMNGWFGDANGYLGNLDLKPETAHTASFTAAWHDSARKDWEFKVTPYYTYVEDYIDVNRCPYDANNWNSTSKTMAGASNATCSQANLTNKKSFVYLQFANHDAELYGVDFSGRMPLWSNQDLGRFALSGVVGFVHGTNLDTGDNLYHMMPINAKVALEHKLGNWTNVVELQMVDAKTDVQWVRQELQTPGYALVNLRTSYNWEHVRLDLGVENVFDQLYYAPLAGADVSTYGRNWGNPVAGMGRAFYAGLTVKF